MSRPQDENTGQEMQMGTETTQSMVGAVTSYQSLELGKFLTESEMLLRAPTAPQLILGTPKSLTSLLLPGFTRTL